MRRARWLADHKGAIALILLGLGVGFQAAATLMWQYLF
jgi:hypothetical protein